MGFWGFGSNLTDKFLQGLGVVTYNSFCDPNPGILPNGTNVTKLKIWVDTCNKKNLTFKKKLRKS